MFSLIANKKSQILRHCAHIMVPLKSIFIVVSYFSTFINYHFYFMFARFYAWVVCIFVLQVQVEEPRDLRQDNEDFWKARKGKDSVHEA